MKKTYWFLFLTCFFFFSNITFPIFAQEGSSTSEGSGHVHTLETPPSIPEIAGTDLLFDKKAAQAFEGIAALRQRHKPLLALSHEFAWALAPEKSIYFLVQENGQTVLKKAKPLNVFLDMNFRPELWGNVPLLRISHPELQTLCHLVDEQAHHPYISVNFFLSLLRANPSFSSLIRTNLEAMNQPNDEGPATKLDDKVRELIQAVDLCQQILDGDVMNIVPHSDDPADPWETPTSLRSHSHEGNSHQEVLSLWDELSASWQQGKKEKFNEQVLAFQKMAQPLTLINQLVPGGQERLDLELKYWRKRPFKSGSYLAMLALMFILPGLAARGGWRKSLLSLGTLVLLAATGMMAWGFWLRSMIADRGPIHSIYETVVYATMGAMILSLLLEWKSRQGWALLMGAIMGCIGSICSAKLGSRLDPNFQYVAPVLRSGWLIVHVQVIILGYSAALLSAGLGHAILIGRIWLQKSHETMRTLDKLCYRSIQFTVLFLTFGILLGAWWANESWGRYWGWDPKETWALISLLVFLALVHLRMIGAIRQLGTAALSILGGMMVIFCWWGVNYVLGVGLHAYATGFSEIMAQSALVYYGIELIFLGFALSKYLEGKSKPA